MSISKRDILTSKELLLKTVGELVKSKRLELGKGILLHSYEYDIPSSSLNLIEKGKRDVQLTTLWKIASSFGMNLSEFIKLIENKLPDDFELN